MTSPSAPVPSRATDAPAEQTGATIRAMRVIQHIITAVLLGIGAVRAIADGAPGFAVVVVAVSFAGLYAAGALSQRRRRSIAVWWLMGLAVVWLGMLVVSAEFVWLAFPLWLLAGYLLRGWLAVLFAAAVLAAVVAAPLVHGRALGAADVIGPLVGGLFAFGIARGYVALTREARERERLVASLVAAQAESAQLQDELAAAQRHSGAIAERTRLSRDIHDTIAQGLTSILLLARAGDTAPDRDRAFGRIEALAQASLVDVRRIVAELAPAELDEQALPGALRRLLARLSDDTGIAALLQVDDDFPTLPTPVEVALLRTAQSALANVRRHAEASRVVVSLSAWGRSVRMDIVDDGRGFDTSTLPAAAPVGGYGLRAITERLRELGGGLDVESTPGDGTALSAHIPLSAAGEG